VGDIVGDDGMAVESRSTGFDWFRLRLRGEENLTAAALLDSVLAVGEVFGELDRSEPRSCLSLC
jgi:hypothetical protein